MRLKGCGDKCIDLMWAYVVYEDFRDRLRDMFLHVCAGDLWVRLLFGVSLDMRDKIRESINEVL